MLWLAGNNALATIEDLVHLCSFILVLIDKCKHITEIINWTGKSQIIILTVIKFMGFDLPDVNRLQKNSESKNVNHRNDTFRNEIEVNE